MDLGESMVKGKMGDIKGENYPSYSDPVSGNLSLLI